MQPAHKDAPVEERGMPSQQPGVPVTLRYWAGARQATGVDSDTLHGCATVGDALVEATRLHPALAPVAAVSSLLLDGRPAHRDAALPQGSVLEVLPPFAGG